MTLMKVKSYICFMRNYIFCVLLLISQITAAGTINIGSTTLPSFGNVYIFHSSVSQRISISANSLSANLQIQVPSGFEISLQYRQGYTSSLTLTATGGNINPTTIYIRFSPSVVGLQNGLVSFASSASATQNISVTGTGINWGIPTAPANYYSTATGSATALKTALHSKISGHTVQSYTPGVWNAFYTTDVQPNGKVWDIYSTRFDTVSPYEFALGTDQDNGTGGTSEGQKYNREHSFPQSYFANASPMVSDIHHIFATDKRVNAQRGDLPYGIVASPNWTSLNGSKRGINTSGTYTGDVFEPVDEYKGDVARAYFYLATRYENVIGSWSANTPESDAILLANNTATVFEPWFLNILIGWHNSDPVSDKEIKRNNAIYAIQDNRNPFIDSPQFVRKIWGGPLPNTPTVNASNLSISNQTTTTVRISWASGNGSNRIVVMRPITSTTTIPADSVRYIANTVYGNGSNLGSNNFVVYNGSSSTVTVTGLTMGTSYNVSVYEYNGWYQTSKYRVNGALTNNFTTLPVSWLYVNAEKTTPKLIKISWSTVSEQNNDFFTIERSTDGSSFIAIANVAGKGNSNMKNAYSVIDDPDNGVLELPNIYYRIKQTDRDGLYSYSDVMVLSNFISNEQIVVSPNPFSQTFTLTSENKLPAPVFDLKDVNGKTIDKQLPYEQVNNQIYFNQLHSLPGGYYCLQIQTADGNIRYIKLIKQ
jgi:endonuclease I